MHSLVHPISRSHPDETVLSFSLTQERMQRPRRTTTSVLTECSALRRLNRRSASFSCECSRASSSLLWLVNDGAASPGLRGDLAAGPVSAGRLQRVLLRLRPDRKWEDVHHGGRRVGRSPRRHPPSRAADLQGCREAAASRLGGQCRSQCCGRVFQCTLTLFQTDRNQLDSNLNAPRRSEVNHNRVWLQNHRMKLNVSCGLMLNKTRVKLLHVVIIILSTHVKMLINYQCIAAHLF